MNPTWPSVDNWWDLIGNIWIGLVVIAAAVVPSVFAARNHRTIVDVKNQVVNGHKTPMRDDLDRAIAAIDDLGHEVRGLRADLLAESAHRRTQISDLADELEHRTGKRRRSL